MEYDTKEADRPTPNDDTDRIARAILSALEAADPKGFFMELWNGKTSIDGVFDLPQVARDVRRQLGDKL